MLKLHLTNVLASSTGVLDHKIRAQRHEVAIYIFPAVRGTVVRVMHIEDGSQEVGRKTRRVASSPTTETNLAQFLPFYTQLASCGCSSQWVTPDKKRNGPAGKLQFFLGELQEDGRKRHVVTSLPSWYIIFDFYSFLPVTALW